MKQLLLLRHAKAMPAEGHMADRDRPLAERGHRDAGLMGAAIAARFPLQRMLCSPSLRTRETMDGVAAAWRPPPAQIVVEALYGGDNATYKDPGAAHGDEADCPN